MAATWTGVATLGTGAPIVVSPRGRLRSARARRVRPRGVATVCGGEGGHCPQVPQPRR
jgi:hypothetical protein